MRIHVKALAVIALILVAVFFVNETQAWSWGKKKEEKTYNYEFPSGWKVMKMKPAKESGKVNWFESNLGCCEFKLKGAFDNGNFKLFEEIRKYDYENWWTLAVYIPDDYFLNVPQNATIIMEAISKQDSTVYIESRRITFCLGGVRGFKNALQHTVFDNSEKGYQVRSSQDPGRKDFEWTNLGEEGGIKYVVGYVYFGDHEKVKEVAGFRFENIDSYPANRTASRR